MEIGPHVFEKSETQTQTDRRGQTDAAALYIDTVSYHLFPKLSEITNISLSEIIYWACTPRCESISTRNL